MVGTFRINKWARLFLSALAVLVAYSCAPTEQNRDYSEALKSDYLQIIEFMADRIDLQKNAHILGLPENTITHSRNQDYLFDEFLSGETVNRIIMHESASTHFIPTGERPDTYDVFAQVRPEKNIDLQKVFAPKTECIGECAKLLLEGHTKSVIYIPYKPTTNEIIVEGVREFRRGRKCELDQSRNDLIARSPRALNPSRTYAIDALGLCIKGTIVENNSAFEKYLGIHIYTNATSPHWPEEIESDLSPPSRDAWKIPRAFENLKNIHVFVAGRPYFHSMPIHRGIHHKAVGAGTMSDKPQISFDRFCLSITPSVQRELVEEWVIEAVGEFYLAEQPFRMGDRRIQVSDESICIGSQRDAVTFFNQNELALDLENILTPQEIEDSLSFWVRKAREQGDNADKEWAAIAYALAVLHHTHSGFDNDIAYRIAPILIETAKYELKHHKDHAIGRPPFTVLKAMPHKSMAPYLDELIAIIESTTTDLGCKNLQCPDDLQRQKAFLSNIVSVLNAAGPEASDFLDSAWLTNRGPSGGNWYIFPGRFAIEETAACVGRMGPAMQERLAKKAFIDIDKIAVSGHSANYRSSINALLSLRMTQQSRQAREHLGALSDKLDDMAAASDAISKTAIKTSEFKQSAAAAKQAILSWSEEKPYCPARHKHNGWK